jgi:hypothetical protein
MQKFEASRSQYAGSTSCYDTYHAEYKKWYKLMWDTPVFTKKRVEYEKKANEALKKQKECGEGGVGIFSAGASAAALWTMKYSKRKVDVSGALGPEDSIIAVAKGMNPGAMIALEDRAVIKGGLMALYLAGLSEANPSSLIVTTLNLKKDDEALIRAAGGKVTGLMQKDLTAAADIVRGKVSAQGDNLKTAAWGLRGNYILMTLVGFQMAHATAAMVVGMMPNPITMVVGAVMSAHVSISKAVAENVSNQMNYFVKDGMEKYAAALQLAPINPGAGGGGGGGGGGMILRGGGGGQIAGGGGFSLSAVPVWGWVVGGLALGAVVYGVTRK